GAGGGAGAGSAGGGGVCVKSCASCSRVTQPRSTAICATCLPLPRCSESASSTCSVVSRPNRTSRFSVDGAGDGAGVGVGAVVATGTLVGAAATGPAEVGGLR